MNYFPNDILLYRALPVWRSVSRLEKTTTQLAAHEVSRRQELLRDTYSEVMAIQRRIMGAPPMEGGGGSGNGADSSSGGVSRLNADDLQSGGASSRVP